MIAALFYLISWPEEGDSLSVVPGQKIVSPSVEELTPGCMCKIKGLETHPAKVVSSGTSTEMTRKLDEMDNEEIDDLEPPKKKAKRGGKENKPATKGKNQQKKKSTTKKKGGYSMAVCIYNVLVHLYL